MVTLANVTHRDPDILSGSLVFVGTRVPVRSLFDYLEGGESIDEFLHQFQSVKREFAIAVLDAAYETVAARTANAKYLLRSTAISNSSKT
jgi:uncharacterized protein (DUF433 family)